MNLKRGAPITDTLSLWRSFCSYFRAWWDQFKVLMIKHSKNGITEDRKCFLALFAHINDSFWGLTLDQSHFRDQALSAVESVQPRDETNRPGPEKNSEEKCRWISKTTLHITNAVCVLSLPSAQILQNMSSKESFRKIWTTGKLLKICTKSKRPSG